METDLTRQDEHVEPLGHADVNAVIGGLLRDLAFAQRPGSNVLLDEIPLAYKDIDEVIEHAKSLIEVKHILRQFINVKGD